MFEPKTLTYLIIPNKREVEGKEKKNCPHFKGQRGWREFFFLKNAHPLQKRKKLEEKKSNS